MGWRDREEWPSIVFLGDGVVENKQARHFEEMRKIMMKNCNIRELCVWVISTSLLQQVRVPIWWVITPIRGLLNPFRQVVLLISHICWYPPYHSHLHPPSLFLIHNSTIIAEHKVKSSLTTSLCQDHELTPSTAYTQYSMQLRLSIFLSFSSLHGDPWM